jgi:hypothetical protein
MSIDSVIDNLLKSVSDMFNNLARKKRF